MPLSPLRNRQLCSGKSVFGVSATAFSRRKELSLRRGRQSKVSSLRLSCARLEQYTLLSSTAGAALRLSRDTVAAARLEPLRLSTPAARPPPWCAA